MNKSESIAAIAAALAKAQAQLKNPVFDSKNPHFKNSYASLASVRDTVTPVLAAHGIAVLQLLGKSDVGVSCETVLTHESGEWISSTIELPATKQDAQGYGSACTYARRYALMAIVNVVGDDDDDANEASRPSPTRPAANAQRHDESHYQTLINGINNATNKADLDAWCADAKAYVETGITEHLVVGLRAAIHAANQKFKEAA
jgi:hypothetical protein